MNEDPFQHLFPNKKFWRRVFHFGFSPNPGNPYFCSVFPQRPKTPNPPMGKTFMSHEKCAFSTPHENTINVFQFCSTSILFERLFSMLVFPFDSGNGPLLTTLLLYSYTRCVHLHHAQKPRFWTKYAHYSMQGVDSRIRVHNLACLRPSGLEDCLSSNPALTLVERWSTGGFPKPKSFQIFRKGPQDVSSALRALALGHTNPKVESCDP